METCADLVFEFKECGFGTVASTFKLKLMDVAFRLHLISQAAPLDAFPPPADVQDVALRNSATSSASVGGGNASNEAAWLIRWSLKAASKNQDGVDTQGLTKKLMIDVFGPWRPLGAQQLGDLSC